MTTKTKKLIELAERAKSADWPANRPWYWPAEEIKPGDIAPKVRNLGFSELRRTTNQEG